MAYTGPGASISQVIPLPLGRASDYTVSNIFWKEALLFGKEHYSASCDLLAAGGALAHLYWLQKEIGCTALGHARHNDEQPNRERA